VGLSERSRRGSAGVADGELVAGVRGGDEESFGRLVERYRAPVTAYVRARLVDRDLSEDIAQEIFISALHSMRCSERPIAFEAWIYEIARNACIDQHRRCRRQAEAVVLDEDFVEGRATSDPQTALETRQRLAALCLAFGALPPLERELLVRRELCGLPYVELALCTGLTVSAVESALHRARRRLLAHYRPLCGEATGPVRAAVAGRASSGPAVGYFRSSSGRGAAW
jgi:RNA polymerase sigma factor (sigma-70 family)